MSPDNQNENHNFEHLADSLPQIIWTARPDGFLDYYNERWYQFSGFVRGEGGDQSWIPLLHPDEVERVKAAWYHSVKTGEDFNFEVRFFDRRQNKYVWFLSNARAVRNTNGEIIKWYGSSTDIDKQKKAEQQVVDILEGMNDSFFSIDSNWNLSRVNSRMEATTNIKREEAVGKNFFLSFPMEKDSKYWINHHKIMDERVPVQYVEYYAPLDLWTEARGYPTPDGGIAYLFRDISVEKRALKKLELLTQELKDAVHARDEFLSIASHELLTPITSLKLQVQIARRTLKSEQGPVSPVLEKMATILDSSTSQIDRLSNLIDGLLDITRIDAGKMTYQFVDVNFSVLVKDIVERYSEELSSLKLNIEPKLHVKCDPFRMEQVLVNLLSNAMKYGGGRQVIVTLEATEKGVSLCVQDHGIGVPEEKRDQIFNRFERAVSHKNISGMGLGLYIAKQIVEAHQGTIEVESELNVGSRFLVRIPSPP